MKNTVIFVVGCLLLGDSAPAQEQPRELRGGGHVLGETAEQFYSEDFAGNILSACQARNWKIVSRLYKNIDASSKLNAKDICAMETLIKQRVTDGARLECKGSGDTETQRADTFTLDGGHLVKIDMVYSTSTVNVEGIHPKSFAGLLAGLQEAYGTPTKTYTESVPDAYGVKYDAHRAVWVGKENVISIIERPGTNGWTEVVAETIGEYSRAAKTENPLQ